jgi:hypothetical protein
LARHGVGQPCNEQRHRESDPGQEERRSRRRGSKPSPLHRLRLRNTDTCRPIARPSAPSSLEGRLALRHAVLAPAVIANRRNSARRQSTAPALSVRPATSLRFGLARPQSLKRRGIAGVSPAYACFCWESLCSRRLNGGGGSPGRTRLLGLMPVRSIARLNLRSRSCRHALILQRTLKAGRAILRTLKRLLRETSSLLLRTPTQLDLKEET